MLSAATLTVTVTSPFSWPVTVILFPLTLTLATSGALLCALIAPVPDLVTVMVLLGLSASRVMLVGERERLPAAFWMLQATVLSPVVPSAHWVPTVSFRENWAL